MGNVDRVFDESRVLKDNAMLKHRPELFYEWDFEKNDELGLDVYKVAQGSHKRAWWKCKDCEEGWDAIISNRARLGSNCPFCSNQRASKKNCLATTHPHLAEEWYQEKNGKVTPFDRVAGSNHWFWWRCKAEGHTWEARVTDRALSNWNCPYCSGHRVWRGYNDLWTTDPDIASWLVDPELGYTESRGSNKVADWECPTCKSIIKGKMITQIRRQGLSCGGCSDGLSFGERFLYNLLSDNEIIFEYEKEFVDWSEGRRYDFYLPSLKWIVEVHGAQHYEKNPFHYRGKTLEEVQDIDRRKKELALLNGIEKYIVIDARKSEVDFLANSIEESGIASLLNIKDYENVGKQSYNSIILKACNLWESGMKSTLLISQELGVYRYTATEYLKKGAKVGLCSYDPLVEMEKSWAIDRGIKIIQLDERGVFVKRWDSIRQASRELKISQKTISRLCKGNGVEIYKGFKWMYAEEYYKEE